MNPPIPEPIVTPRELVRGSRPPAMKYFIAGNLVLITIGFLSGGGTALSELAYLIAVLGGNAIWLFLLRLFWQGRNWARVAIMVWCVMGTFMIFRLHEFSTLQ